MTNIFRTQRPFILTLLVVCGALGILFTQMATDRWVDLVFRGLTLGMLYFLVASGLSLIFGLMDVLNFAHGSLFMIGAYGAWSFFTTPQFLWVVVPLGLVLTVGWLLGTKLGSLVSLDAKGWLVRILPWLAGGIALGVAWVGMRGLNLAELATVNPLPTMPAMPILPGLETETAPELPLALRAGLLGIGGLVGSAGLSAVRDRRGQGDLSWPWLSVIVLGLASGGMMLSQESGPAAILGMGSNLRFALAMLVGTGLGALAGMLMETTLIRPLYERPLFQVLVTLGLTFVITQGTRAIFGPTGYQMGKPAFFDTPLDGRGCTSENFLAFLSENCLRVNIWGATIPSYRLFIIALGLVLLVGVGLLLQRSRLGIIIRAGVQDSEMVEALGINVRRVFTLVFALGAGIAALGGAAAAPLLRVDPDIGLTYQLQAFVVVVLGGMGSFGGAAVGALIVGLAEAFSTYLVTSFRISTSIATASTVIIMAVVLLVRPAGLFGKKE